MKLSKRKKRNVSKDWKKEANKISQRQSSWREARFPEFGRKRRQVGNPDPELSNQENFSPNKQRSQRNKSTYPFRRLPVQVRSRPGYRYARATTPGWSRRLWTIDARVSLGSCERGAMQTNLHLAASPLKRPFAPSSALRVGVRGLLFSERTTFS